MSGRPTLRRILVALALAAAVWCGVRNFHLPPELSRAFSHVPDGVENTLAMKSLMDGRGYTIRLNGVRYPSRYQPWFSCLFVAPALYFARGNVLCSHYGVFAAGIVALGAAFLLGRKLGGGFCGVWLAAVLGALADFARYANVPMTEAPYTMLLIFAALAWLGICEKPETRVPDYLLFGTLCALAGALRSTALVLPLLAVLPLWKRRPGRRTIVAVLAAAWLPALAVAAANAVWNKAVWGSFLRGGYNFWDPLYYDYPGMTFSLRFILPNLRGYANAANGLFILLPALVTAAALAALRRGKDEKFGDLAALAVFAAAVTGVTAALYLPYFSFQERFFVPVRTLVTLCGAAAAGTLIRAHLKRGGEALLGAAALATAFAPWPSPYAKQLEHDELRSAKIALLEKMRGELPENAVLLTIFQQGAAEYFFVGESSRRIIPFFRCYEYAQMVTSKRRLPAPPGGFRGGRNEHEERRYLAEHGGVRPYPAVFAEDPEVVDGLVASGVPVYVSDYTLLIHRPARELGKRYRLAEAGEWGAFHVYRLLPADGTL